MADSRFFDKKASLFLKDVYDLLGIFCPQNLSDVTFDDVAPLSSANPSQISCYHNTKYIESLKNTKAGLCFVKKEHSHLVPNTTIAFVSDSPYRCFGKVAQLFYKNAIKNNAISDKAEIHPSVKIGKNCKIGPFCVIEENVILGDFSTIESSCTLKRGVVIGDGAFIEPSVTIGFAEIGKNVYIKTGARIGQRGFGFHMDSKGVVDVPQLGRVIIGDNVQIGANVAIDRGSLNDTIIGNNVRIDNLVQIAHNVKIGDGSILVAQSGIAGSTELGRFVIIAGQVGIAGHLKIGDNVKIAAQSGVMRDINNNETVGGSPALLIKQWHRQTVLLKKMTTKE
ncbi:MAG: UDP-3-O-(3-hydroxymyristoyl)glucosamine N-acyltransferase [Alphaproteobacteria bacterium]